MAKKDENLPVAASMERFLVLKPEVASQLAEVIETNLGDDFTVLDLEKVKFPTGGMTLWTVNDAEGEKHVPVLSGVIVAQKSARQYWKDPFSGGGSPPECQSIDMVRGQGLYQGVPCATCQWNQYGSAVNAKGEETKGKACKEVKNVLLLMENSLLPVVLQVPPTSLKLMKQYNVKLASKGVPFYGAITEFGLRKTKNAGGIEYAELVISMGEMMNVEEQQSIRSYVEGFKAALDNAAAAESVGPPAGFES